MMQHNLRFAMLAVLILSNAGRAASVDLIANGDFEAGGGSFSGWNHLTRLASGDWFVQQGTSSPLLNSAVPVPPGATHAAMTDTNAPGAHVLYQDFTVPAVVTHAALHFSRYVNNLNPVTEFASPASLDVFAGNPRIFNEQVRVDIIKTTADPFSVVASDVIQNLYQSQPGDPHESGYTVQGANLTSLLSFLHGQTLRLRFAEADNQGVLLFGVDQVSLIVPEPSTLVLAAFGFTALAAWGWRRKR